MTEQRRITAADTLVRTVRGQEHVGSTLLHTPYYYGLTRDLQQDAGMNTEQLAACLAAVDVADRQMVDNFTSFESKTAWPGVRFSVSKMTPGADVIQRMVNTQDPQRRVTPEYFRQKEADIQAQEVLAKMAPWRKASQQEYATKSSSDDAATDVLQQMTKKPRKKILYFCFQSINLMPDADHALNSPDLGHDRFMRALAIQAGYRSRGEEVPEIEIHMIGSPQGLGGDVTPEYLQAVDKRGFKIQGDLFAEYIRNQITLHATEGERPHVILQGVSRGGRQARATADVLATQVSSEKMFLQVLADNSADGGIFQPFGFVGEGVVRTLFDPTALVNNEYGRNFSVRLAEHAGLSPDSQGSKARKAKLMVIEGKHLLKHRDKLRYARGFNRVGWKDPVTTSPKRVLQALDKSLQEENSYTAMTDEEKLELKSKKRYGEEHTVITDNSHIYMMYQKFGRWTQIVNACLGFPDKK